MIKDIFKTSIFITNLNLDLEHYTKKCEIYCENNKKVIKSNEGGYQSDNLDLKNWKELVNAIEQSVNSEADNYYPLITGTKDSLKVGNMWININNNAHFNRYHIHPNSKLAGVYYIQTPENCGDLNFERPDVDSISYYKSYDSEHDEIVDENTFSEVNVPAKENKIVLFPPYIRHMVKPNLNLSYSRISISFNMVRK